MTNKNKLGKNFKPMCLSIGCPERKGGKCNAEERIINPEYSNELWKPIDILIKKKKGVK